MTDVAEHTVVIIPTYNNADTLAGVLTDVIAQSLPVIVINDGSTDDTADILLQFPAIRIITHAKNRGKGIALRTGLREAAAAGYQYAITLDSDGQHYADDIPLFLEKIIHQPDSLLIGARNLTSENMPGKNTFANRFSNFWFRLETGIKLEDTQSGYRLYPLYIIRNMKFFTSKYEFELEVIVRTAWKGTPVINIPVKVYYPPQEERVSHFHPLRDFTRISLLNTVLVIIAFLWYWPWKFIRALTKENIRRFIAENITRSGESNLKIALAVGFGVFMGIFPVWGYQMILATLIAHFLGLNKVITLVASNISIPPMIPFILFGSYATGALVMGKRFSLSLHDVTFDTIKDSLIQYLLGSVVFALVCGLSAGLVCLLLLSFFRKPVIHT